MSEPEWMRNSVLACEFCGAPGHLVPIAPPVTAYAALGTDPSLDDLAIKTRIACPEHRFLVIERAKREADERYYAQSHGRPDGWGETEPERIRQAMRLLLDRLRDAGQPVDDLEARARQKGML